MFSRVAASAEMKDGERSMAVRLGMLTNTLVNFVADDAYVRVAKLILHLGLQHGIRRGKAIELGVVLTHQEIANMAGVNRQTVTTILGDLRKKRVLSVQRRRIRIDDPAMLNETRLFNAQEATHSQTHRRHVDVLIDRHPALRRVLAHVVEGLLPRRLREVHVDRELAAEDRLDAAREIAEHASGPDGDAAHHAQDGQPDRVGHLEHQLIMDLHDEVGRNRGAQEPGGHGD